MLLSFPPNSYEAFQLRSPNSRPSNQVVAVFGSIHMGASRIMNLQRHRIAQCRSVVIRIFGDEGVPVQADGEAWVHPPGIIRIMHKNRVQITCRDRVSEREYPIGSNDLFQRRFN